MNREQQIERLQQLSVQHGVELSAEQLEQLQAHLPAELSETDLEAIASGKVVGPGYGWGGGWGWGGPFWGLGRVAVGGPWGGVFVGW